MRQFVKFCIVGAATSTVVNFTFLNILYFGYIGCPRLPLLAAVTIAFIISVMNGFAWNRHWTFKEQRGRSAANQSVKYLLVNIVGWLLNTTIVVLFIAHFTSTGSGFFGHPGEFSKIATDILTRKAKTEYSGLLVNGSQLSASCVVVIWNFLANRHWTFKH